MINECSLNSIENCQLTYIGTGTLYMYYTHDK
jgi:hypothetical protein